MKSRTFSLMTAVAIGALMIGLAPSAKAGFSPTMLLCISDSATGLCQSGDFIELVSDGSTVSVISSGGTFVNTSSSTGGSNITFVGSIGSVFSLTVDTGTKDLAGNPQVDLAYQDTAKGAGKLNIFWGATGFTGGAPQTGSIGGTNNASSTAWNACIENTTSSDPTVFNFCGGAGLPTTGVIGSGSSSLKSFSTDFSSGALNTTNPFGLLEEVFITSTGEGGSSGDMGVSGVPEPASVSLLGGALLLAARAMRRKIRG